MNPFFTIIPIVLFIFECLIVSHVTKKSVLLFERGTFILINLLFLTFDVMHTSILWSSILNIFLLFYLVFYGKIRIKNKERFTEEIVYAVFIPLTLWWIIWLCMYIENLIREWFEINALLVCTFIFIPPIISGYILWQLYRSARVINTLLALWTAIAVWMTISDITTDTVIDVRYVIYGISISCFLLCISSIYSYISNIRK